MEEMIWKLFMQAMQAADWPYVMEKLIKGNANPMWYEVTRLDRGSKPYLQRIFKNSNIQATVFYRAASLI